MNDLIERVTTYARSAGRTGLGQYNAATKTEGLSLWLNILSIALTAAVGTSIFTTLLEKSSSGFLHAGVVVIAVAATVLTAINASAKLGERAERHRLAGAEYGRLRRKADTLRLRIEGGDIGRDQALAEIDELAEALSKTAKESPALSSGIYKPAMHDFDRTHHQYAAVHGASHAGGVVYQDDVGVTRYLVVQAKNAPDEWVLPKGHIEHGESAEQTARREVHEESGVDAAVLGVLDTVEFSAPRGRVKARFFLMKALSKGQPSEGRAQAWLDFDDAIKRLQYKEAQYLVMLARAAIEKMTDAT